MITGAGVFRQAEGCKQTYGHWCFAIGLPMLPKASVGWMWLGGS